MTPSLSELKAQAYDTLVQIEAWNKKLIEINQLIANYSVIATPETKEEEK